MRTRYWRVNPFHPEKNKIIEAASLIRAGNTVAFPTETVYGLGADAFNPEAVQKIFTAKGRPADNPLIIHVAYWRHLEKVVQEIPPEAALLVRRFWPGPLTLVLPKSPEVPHVVTAGLDTVAVRMPRHRVALELIRRSRCPVAAPSANVSGRPSPTAADHVLKDMYGVIGGILDGGSTSVGVESTVLDLSSDVPTILRPGGVTREQLERVLKRVRVSSERENLNGDEFIPRSPGMKYRHYSPRGELYIIHGNIEKAVGKIKELVLNWQKEGKKVAVLCSRETQQHYLQNDFKADLLMVLGSRKEPKTVARKLYEALHRCDEENMDVILVEEFPFKGIGYAVMNRIIKASGNRIIQL
ncbi:MAG: threonylcarbamoyl-AMP synthase [Clostridia bacterium]|nr:threonylcarbamoyl-AMP synthase [Clostridia bacterium]